MYGHLILREIHLMVFLVLAYQKKGTMVPVHLMLFNNMTADRDQVGQSSRPTRKADSCDEY